MPFKSFNHFYAEVTKLNILSKPISDFVAKSSDDSMALSF